MPVMELRCRGKVGCVQNIPKRAFRRPSLRGNDVQHNTRQLARKRSKSCKSTVTCDLHHRRSIQIAFELNAPSSSFRKRSLVTSCIMTLAAIFSFPLLVLASALLPRSADGSLGVTVRTSQGPIIGHSASNRSHVNEFWVYCERVRTWASCSNSNSKPCGGKRTISYYVCGTVKSRPSSRRP
jgi:hypothetical protein